MVKLTALYFLYSVKNRRNEKVISPSYFSSSHAQAFAQTGDLKAMRKKGRFHVQANCSLAPRFSRASRTGNREVRTAGIVADVLKVAGHGSKNRHRYNRCSGYVKGWISGPGGGIAFRAGCLAGNRTYACAVRIKSTTTYNGQTVGVMHACGHDSIWLC